MASLQQTSVSTDGNRRSTSSCCKSNYATCCLQFAGTMLLIICFALQFVCHMKANIKYSPLKMWYVACLVRGMQIDDAIRQLDYVQRKGAKFVKEALIEAQELAVQKHNVEFRSNLWVGKYATLNFIPVTNIYLSICFFHSRIILGERDRNQRNPATRSREGRNNPLSLLPLLCEAGRRLATRELLSRKTRRSNHASRLD